MARNRFAAQILSNLDREGGEPDSDGSTAGYLRQRFLDLKAAITGRDDKEKFEAALSQSDLSGELSGAVDRAYASVRQGRDRVSAQTFDGGIAPNAPAGTLSAARN